jgi:hypothetical protein
MFLRWERRGKGAAEHPILSGPLAAKIDAWHAHLALAPAASVRWLLLGHARMSFAIFTEDVHCLLAAALTAMFCRLGFHDVNGHIAMLSDGPKEVKSRHYLSCRQRYSFFVDLRTR